MIHLEEITPDNWREELKVSEEQKRFVSSSAALLARAYAFRNERSVAYMIYNDDTSIGMALYYDCDELNAYDFSQLFIDERYQGHGYGKQAASMILDCMRHDSKYDEVILCYIKGNDVARDMYEKLGFFHTGEADEDEIIMKCRLYTVSENL